MDLAQVNIYDQNANNGPDKHSMFGCMEHFPKTRFQYDGHTMFDCKHVEIVIGGQK